MRYYSDYDTREAYKFVSVDGRNYILCEVFLENIVCEKWRKYA